MPRKVIIYEDRICEYCNSIYRNNIDHKKRKYCGYKCAKNARKKQITVICKTCNKEFIVQEYRKDSKFCSAKCWHDDLRSDILVCKCKNCGDEFLRKEHLIKRANNIFCTKKCADEYNTGKNHYEYKEHLHDKNMKLALKQWGILIKERDNYTCQECGDTRNEVLEAHHIIHRSEDISRVFDMDNGITLCWWCHSKKHVNDKKSFRLIQYKINNYGKVKMDSISSQSRA